MFVSLTLMFWCLTDALLLQVRRAWAHEIVRCRWGRAVRANVINRRDNGHSLTEKELDDIRTEEEDSYTNVTDEEILQAFDNGAQVCTFSSG